MGADISTMLRDEYVNINSDGWTSCVDNSYHTLSVTVAEQSELVALPLSCTESEVSTTGDYTILGNSAMRFGNSSKHSIYVGTEL